MENRKNHAADMDMINNISSLADISLTDEEKAVAAGDMKKILEFFDRLKSVDTEDPDLDTDNIPDNAKELWQNALRPDVPEDSLMAEEIFSLAPDRRDGMYKVPRTI